MITQASPVRVAILDEVTRPGTNDLERGPRVPSARSPAGGPPRGRAGQLGEGGIRLGVAPVREGRWAAAPAPLAKTGLRIGTPPPLCRGAVIDTHLPQTLPRARDSVAVRAGWSRGARS